MSLCYLDEVDSTNNWLRRELQGLQDGAAVYTGSQTAGKGRRGRSWQNQPGEALYYSRLVRRPLKDPATLPLMVSLAGADAVEALCGRRPQVKWPNDLLFDGKKICGILCESVLEGDGASYILGVGINLLQTAAFFEAQGLDHAASLYSATGRRCLSRDAALALDGALTRRLESFAGGGFAALAEEYRACCINLGRQVYTDTVRGVAAAIDDAGRLVVRTAQGQEAVFTGEVTVHGIY